MKTKVIALFVFATLFAWTQSVSANPSKEKAAIAAATQWLEKVDQGKYSDSWTTAASFFKSKVTNTQCTQTLW